MEAPKRIPQLVLIFAKDENNVLGKDNGIPWKSPHDFRWFRYHTIGHSVIMGRKTWESLPGPAKPLVNRTNYVISRNPDYHAGQKIITDEQIIVKISLQDAIDASLQENKDGLIFVIGGKALLEEASKLAEKAYVSRIGVRTPVDETCVMAPELPEHVVEEINELFNGDELNPSVIAEIIRFI